MHIKKVEGPFWYLLYTNPRTEKKVNEELVKRGFETFLPIHKTLRNWSDRKKWIEEPLFKGYIFINTELERKYFEILNIPGVVKFVTFESKPVIVDIREIEMVRLILGEFQLVESLQKNEGVILEGEEIEIISGILMGFTGKLINYKGKHKVLIECKSLEQLVALELPLSTIKKVETICI